MFIRQLWKQMVCILFLYPWTACGGPSPEQFLDEAKAAIQAAEQAGAGTYAPWHLADARDDLFRAERDMKKTAAETDVKALAKGAKEKAERARTEAAKNKAILQADPDDPNEVAVMDTKMGRIVLELFPEVAPNHVANFKKLAKVGFYNGTTFHRVIPGFMIQGGSPTSKDDDRSNDGVGGPGYTMDAEFNDRPHLRGILSMARSRDPNSAGSQFFICVAPQPQLDHRYTIFGQVIQGMEVVDQIVHVPRDQMDNPLDRIEMTVSIVDRDTLPP